MDLLLHSLQRTGHLLPLPSLLPPTPTRSPQRGGSSWAPVPLPSAWHQAGASRGTAPRQTSSGSPLPSLYAGSGMEDLPGAKSVLEQQRS